MTREAIEKAIKEHENALGLYTSPAGRNTVLRSLVDAVLEEAAKAARARWTQERDIATQNGLAAGCLAASDAILALKSQEPAKP